MSFTGSSTLPDFCFSSNIALTAIVGRFNLGINDEDEQGIQALDLLVLEADESLFMNRHRFLIYRRARLITKFLNPRL